MMAKQLKVATLNLCLGLKNKKDLVKELLMSNEIDILAMQEIELESNFDCNLLSIPGFTLETENTRNKKRVGIYIRNNVKYERCTLLEEEDNNLVIIDVIVENISRRIVNIYRSFNPPGLTAKDLFIRQCRLVRVAFNSGTIFLGDFNLDYRKKHDVNYSNANLFAVLDEGFDDLNLLQLVNFSTWSSIVGNTFVELGGGVDDALV